MRDERAQAVMRALGVEQAMFVGGCVRDALMKRGGGDLDIATVLLPHEAQERLHAQGIRAIPTGIDHGTISAIVDGASFEITTLRKDVATDGRRAVVAFTRDWHDDARRRDFTINALYADTSGHVYDPLEQGIDDLDRQRLRFVGDAARRIAEDYLRILRYFRFAAQFGWVLDDAQALLACRDAAPRISALSKERVTQEILKLLAAPEPGAILEQMRVHDIMPELLGHFDSQEMEALVSQHVLTRLALLTKPERRLVLSKGQKRHVETVRDGGVLVEDETVSTIKRLVYLQGNELAFEIYAFYCARQKKEPQAALLDILQNWQAPVFPTTGEDLIKQGYQPGPALGQKLKELEAAWMDAVF